MVAPVIVRSQVLVDAKQDRPPEPIVSFRHLATWYGSFQALADINLDMPRNQLRRSSGLPAAARAPCCAPSTG